MVLFPDSPAPSIAQTFTVTSLNTTEYGHFKTSVQYNERSEYVTKKEKAMCSAVCKLILFQLLFDFFVFVLLPFFPVPFIVGNIVAETPHRTEVRFQKEENAPVVLPNKKFLFS